MSDIIGMIPRCWVCRHFPLHSWCDADVAQQGLDGRFLAIEVKSSSGKPTAVQQNFLDTVNAAGGKGFVARSVDDVKRELGL